MAHSSAHQPPVSDLEPQVLRKITARIVPFVVALYFVSFLNRVNVGFAALTMNRDLGLSAQMFGVGAGIFFVGYLLFGLPSNLLLHRVGARRMVALSLAGTVGPIVIGRLKAQTGSYSGGMIYVAATLLLSSIVVLFAAPKAAARPE
jgi:ACS family tartrate transporter-like MFS transporter